MKERRFTSRIKARQCGNSQGSHIQLFRSGNLWMADHAGPIADQVMDLFGTTLLPTAFASTAAADDVRDAVQKLNPDTVVTVSVLRGGAANQWPTPHQEVTP